MTVIMKEFLLLFPPPVPDSHTLRGVPGGSSLQGTLLLFPHPHGLQRAKTKEEVPFTVTSQLLQGAHL